MMESLISSISVNSKAQSFRKEKANEGSSTRNDSKVLQLDSIQSFSSQNFIQSTHTIAFKDTQKKIQQIQMAQKQLTSKFQKVKDNLLEQIEKKDEMNQILEQEVIELRSELEESKKDFGIITQYLKKKSQKIWEKPNRKTPLLNSTKGSTKIDTSKPSSKDSITINSSDKYNKKKSNSPRTALFKRF